MKGTREIALDATVASMDTTAPVDHERLTELFAKAIDMPAAERDAWMAKLAGDEPAIAKELASLLRSDASDGLRTADLVPTVDLRDSRPTVTVVIPGYRVTNVIGEGGMGTVYAGEQEDPKRPVAIKILHVRSPNALARFKTEAQIMARLDHPGIARVLEAGEANGQPFLVMEHVDGETLDRYAKAVSLERKLAMFAALCDAVHHAHVKGVIHRDLKPANVMVKAGDRIVVLDFGVARLVDDLTSNDTRAGDLLGTPVYMSPEQARLRPEEVDARSDGYTLGVILYELICGELPYDVRGMPLPAVTCVITEDQPIPLRKRDASSPRDLEAITGKALQKEPNDRYPSVAALAEDVRRFLARLPVSVRVPGARERFARFVKRRPIVAAAIGGSVFVVVAFAIVVTLLWVQARSARRVAEDARAHAESRTNELTLRQARAALGRDPTEAIAWLETLTPRDVDPATAWGIAREAIGRGVAKDILREHTDEVHWVEPLAQGEGFVTGGYDGKALLWEGSPTKSKPLFVAKKGRIHAVRPSPDGAKFVIGGDSGELHVVARDGHVLGEFLGHEGDVQHLAWSADGAWLATADDHGHVYAWPHGSTPGKLLVSAKTAIGAIAFGAGGVLVAGSHDGMIYRWDLATGASNQVAIEHDVDEVWADATHVAAVDVDGTVRSWRVEGETLAIEHTVATERKLKRALFAPTGWVLLGGVGGSVVLVDGEHVETIGAHRSQVRSLAISPDGRWFADGGDDGELYVHDRSTGRELALRGHNGRIRHLAFSPAGGVLLSSDSDGVVRRWEVASIPPDVLDAGGAPIVKLAVSPDGAIVATTDENGDVARWKVADGARSKRGNIRGRVRELAVVDGVVVTGTAEGIVTWWKDEPVTQNPGGSVEGLAASRDRVAIATSKGPIALYTTAGDPREVLPGHAGGTLTVAFDPSGTLLASGGQDREVRVWRRTGDVFEASSVLAGLHADTHFVAFTPDGSLLVTAGNDGEVATYAVRGGVVSTDRVVVAKHVGAISALAVDDRAIASAGRDSTVIRTPRGGAPTSIALHSAATDLAITDGGIYAISRAGAVERWVGDRDRSSVIEIDHGARAGTASASRWIYAIDGAVVLADPHVPPFAELPPALAHATNITPR